PFDSAGPASALTDDEKTKVIVELSKCEPAVRAGNLDLLELALEICSRCQLEAPVWLLPHALEAIKRLLQLNSRDPPPLKWSDLRYVFDIKEDCNGKEAIQARRDRREAAPGGCSGLAGARHDGGDPPDRGERGDLLSLASRVWRAEDRA